MVLKVNNFFRYYMFHLNADELTAGEKAKATIATVALGVFSLGIIPLVCRLAFYDKSFKSLKEPKKGSQEEKTSTLARDLALKSKTSGANPMLSVKEIAREYLSRNPSNQKFLPLDTNEQANFVKTLNLQELTLLGAILSDEQLLNFDLRSLNGNKERFDALFPLNDPKADKILKNFDTQQLRAAKDLLSSEQLARLYPKQIVELTKTLNPQELTFLSSKLSYEQLLKFDLRSLNHSKERFDALYPLNDPKADRALNNFDRDQLIEAKDLLSNEQLKRLQDKQLKVLINFGRNDSKYLINLVNAVYLSNPKRASEMDLPYTEYSYIEKFLPADLRRLHFKGDKKSNLPKEVLEKLETLDVEELKKYSDELTDYDVITYDFTKIPFADLEKRKQIIELLFPNKLLDKRAEKCIPLLLPKQLDAIYLAFSNYHWAQLSDDQLKYVDPLKIADEEERKQAIEAIFSYDSGDRDKQERRLIILKDRPGMLDEIRKDLGELFVKDFPAYFSTETS